MTVCLSWAEPPSLTFHSSDRSFTLQTPEDYRVTFNPHAILSLASLDGSAIVVTKHKADQTVEALYDNFAKTIPRSSPCRGRLMTEVDGVPAAAFVIEGLFPPQGEITHQTLMVLAIREGQEYDFMLHYPIEREQVGLEDAYATLATIRWAPLDSPHSSSPPAKNQD